jgi:hypothetical protein
MNSVGANFVGTAVVNNGTAVPEIATSLPIIDLDISAQRLKNVDVLTKSDPICILYLFRNGRWEEFARTEVIWNNLDPAWVKFFRVKHIFEIRQPLKFRVYDVDSDTARVQEQDFIGEADIDLGVIVANPHPTELTFYMQNRKGERGKLTIVHEQAQNCASVVGGRIVGIQLKKMSVFAQNDPFFVIAKASESGRWLPILQSEVSRSMRWRRFVVPLQILTNLDNSRPLRITFFDHRARAESVPIGFTDTTFAQLTESIGQPINIIDDQRELVGVFRLEEFVLEERYNFYDYLRSGLQLNLITAIDFTASNGHPQDPRSLDFINPQVVNPYEACIRAVGEILCQYDSDQLFPVFGFAGMVAGRPNHCFELTFNPQAPCVQGLQGILGAYRNAIYQVPLSGPTLFSQIIRRVSYDADKSYRESRTYSILLIITDGVINDMQDTIDAIVDAGLLPISIIIVGVGSADFTAMQILDADDRPLVSSRGRKMVRDIVQFVPFRKYARQHYTVLASEVLAEVPTQLVEWANMHHIRPTS